jgi:hypothetical protein
MRPQPEPPSRSPLPPPPKGFSNNFSLAIVTLVKGLLVVAVLGAFALSGLVVFKATHPSCNSSISLPFHVQISLNSSSCPPPTALLSHPKTLVKPTKVAPKPVAPASAWLHYQCGANAPCVYKLGAPYGLVPGNTEAMSVAACKLLLAQKPYALSPWNGHSGDWCSSTSVSTKSP